MTLKEEFELNGFLEKSPHALVRPGAVLTFQPKY